MYCDRLQREKLSPRRRPVRISSPSCSMAFSVLRPDSGCDAFPVTEKSATWVSLALRSMERDSDAS